MKVTIFYWQVMCNIIFEKFPLTIVMKSNSKYFASVMKNNNSYQNLWRMLHLEHFLYPTFQLASPWSITEADSIHLAVCIELILCHPILSGCKPRPNLMCSHFISAVHLSLWLTEIRTAPLHHSELLTRLVAPLLSSSLSLSLYLCFRCGDFWFISHVHSKPLFISLFGSFLYRSLSQRRVIMAEYTRT